MKRIPPELAERLLAVSRQALDPDEPFSMNRVAQISGIPRATLYYYFSGKDDLASFFASWAVSRVAESAKLAAQAPGPIADRLERALLAALTLAEDEPELDVALMRTFNESGALLNRMMEMRDVGFAPIRALLAEGQASGELVIKNVDLMFTAVFGAGLLVSLQALISAQPFDRNEVVLVIRSFIKGMLPTAPAAAPRRRSRAATS